MSKERQQTYKETPHLSVPLQGWLKVVALRVYCISLTAGLGCSVMRKLTDLGANLPQYIHTQKIQHCPFAGCSI